MNGERFAENSLGEKARVIKNTFKVALKVLEVGNAFIPDGQHKIILNSQSGKVEAEHYPSRISDPKDSGRDINVDLIIK